MLTLALAKEEGPFGWGMATKYLTRELSRKTDWRTMDLGPFPDKTVFCEGKVLHAVTDITFKSVLPLAGEYNTGYCFFELNLTSESVRNAMAYDHIFCGSSYNRNVLAASDVFHSSVLIQGVDHDIFKPKRKRREDGKFVLFSGGKFEYRKGQDLVIAAFKRLMDKYPDMHLVTAWENQWPVSMATMAHSKHIEICFNGGPWHDRISSICALNGIPHDRVTHYPIVSQGMLADIMAETDVGVFPNRCEGGTNLVLMEYMSCGKPVMASYNTGHMDILSPDGTNAILLREHGMRTLEPIPVAGFTAKWHEPDLDELIHAIEWAYHNRRALEIYGDTAGMSMQDYTWGATADEILRHMNNPALDKPDYLSQRYTFGNLLTRMKYDGEGAEIGVYRAGFSRFVYSRWNGRRLHLIDRWEHVEGYEDKANRSQGIHDALHDEVCEIFKGRTDVNIMRMDSIKASNQFEDGQLDWVYIDADHSYEAVKADIEAWCPKVRIGGLVAGHDFFDGVNDNGIFGVKTAVLEFVAKHGHKLQLSADEANPLRTWYFVKDR